MSMPQTMRCVWLVWLLTLSPLSGCRRDEQTAKPAPSARELPIISPASTEVRDAHAGLEPLRSDPPITTLEIENFPSAVISIPLGAASPKPIVIATHGMWDMPEGLCDNWRWIVGDRAWVICVRGDRMPDKTFRYRSSQALAKEIDAGVRALAKRFPGYVDEGPMLYTGFSHGAILGVQLVAGEPEKYPFAIFTEGGEDLWTAALAKKFASGGGKRILFACGLRGRVPTAETATKILRKAGIDARVVLGKLPDAGQFMHWYNGPVAEEERAQLGWLLGDDSRWATAEK